MEFINRPPASQHDPDCRPSIAHFARTTGNRSENLGRGFPLVKKPKVSGKNFLGGMTDIGHSQLPRSLQSLWPDPGVRNPVSGKFEQGFVSPALAASAKIERATSIGKRLQNYNSRVGSGL